MKNLFIKIMLIINALVSVYPCGFYLKDGLRIPELHYLIYFSAFHAIQTILSAAMFIYICKSEDKHKESDVNNKTDDKNK